jgi:spore coat polysaccharide biosynthesis protein SpsF
MDIEYYSRTWVIMQARVGSTRLPDKILKPILGRAILEHDIERCLRVRNCAGVVVAMTVAPEDDKVVELCSRFPAEKVKSYRGSVQDVLGRYNAAAETFDVQYIVRITSDCPLLDPCLVDEMIEEYFSLKREGDALDYLTNNMPPTFPHGLDTEIISLAALARANLGAKEPLEREHVTPYIRRHPDLFKIRNFAQAEDQSHHRWTLDYPEDYEFIKTVYEHLYPAKPDFSREDVMNLLRRHPEIEAINQMWRQR